MKSFIVFTSALLLSSFVYSQQIKTVKNKISKFEIETYEVLKSDKSIKHGKYKFEKNGRVITMGHYSNGQKEGEWAEYEYKNLINKSIYKAGTRNGKSQTFHNNGQVATSGEYANDQKNGQWSYWDSKGRIKAKGNFENDNREGIWKFYTKGNLYQTFNPETNLITYAGPVGSDTLTGIKDGPYKGLIFVDSYPEFKDEKQTLYSFLGYNMRYPPIAQDNNIQGRVYTQFYVDQDGSISDLKVLRGIGGGCDEEALRVIIASEGKWKPAQFQNENVPYLFVLPIVFKLQ